MEIPLNFYIISREEYVIQESQEKDGLMSEEGTV
jgi:hypothetical protein